MTTLKRFELWLARTAFGARMTKAFAAQHEATRGEGDRE